MILSMSKKNNKKLNLFEKKKLFMEDAPREARKWKPSGYQC